MEKQKSACERALAHLMRHEIADAAEELAGAGDYRLALLLAQLPRCGNPQYLRELMAEQIHSWFKSDESTCAPYFFSVLLQSND